MHPGVKIVGLKHKHPGPGVSKLTQWQSALDYYFDFYSVDCRNPPKLAPCICGTSGKNFYASVLTSASSKASAECNGGASEGALATSAFNVYCSSNGVAPTSVRAAGTFPSCVARSASIRHCGMRLT